MSVRKISVVVPVYNEHENIATCLRGLWAALEGVEHELLVVYDFDGDTTLGAIREMGDAPPSLRLVKNPVGKGAANAIRAGFAAASGDVVVTSMADLCDPPEKILELARTMRERGVAVVAGSRYMPGGAQEGGPLVKRTLSRVAGLSLHWLCGIGTHDATNNFKAYSKAFLERTLVEAQGAFDIGLELTVKAHLSGSGVAEVPTSWRDRSAGESRFKVVAWAPKYLRWYFAALREPVVVWIAWLGLLAWTARSALWREAGSGGDLGLSLLHAALGAWAILLGRVARGRMRWWDGLLALPWTNPWHAEALRAGRWSEALGVALAASAALLLLGCGPRRVARSAAHVAREALSLDGLRWVLTLGLALVLWLRLFHVPEVPRSVDLDPSWVAAYPYFAARGLLAGIDYVYTYGPLSHLMIGGFEPAQSWTRIVLWDGAFEASAALVIAIALVRVGDWFMGLVAGAALCLLALSPDVLGSVLCMAAATVGIRNVHSGWLRALCLTLLAALGLTKFTFLPQAQLAALAIVAAPMLQRSWWSASVRLAFFVAISSALWFAAGQGLSNIDDFLFRSIELSRGYGAAMSRVEQTGEFASFGLAALAGLAVVLALRVLPGPRTSETVITALVALLIAAVSYKSCVVRHGFSGFFVAVAVVAPFLVPEELRSRPSWARWSARIARAALGAVLLLAAFEHGATLRPSLGESLVRTRFEVRRGADTLRYYDQVRGRAEEARDAMRAQYALPHVKELVGDEPLDVLGDEQGVAVFNDLNWRPRPVFQSYSAHSASLCELNGEYLRGERAPRFVLQRLSSIDRRYAPCVDSGALLEVLANYTPSAVERGFLLWERKPPAQRRTLAPQALREVEFELGDWIDLRDVAGLDLLARFEVRATAAGRMRALLAAAAPLSFDLTLADGTKHQLRGFPELLAHDFLVSPCLNDQEEVVRWILGRPRRPIALRIAAAPGFEAAFESRARLVLSRLPDFAPSAFAGDASRLEYSMFETSPTSTVLQPGARRARLAEREVLVVLAPSELRYKLEPGRYQLRALLGVLPEAWLTRPPSDGVRCSVRLGDAAPLKEWVLDPVDDEAARQPKPVLMRLQVDAPTELVLATDPGPQGDSRADTVYWTGVKVVRIGRKR